jgi:prepilin-type N-terminal cleavage/methylation domain-containing protein
MKAFSMISEYRRNHRPVVAGAKGFTIIELCVGMVVLAIMAAFAAPQIARYSRNVSLRNAIYQISGDLHTVKTQAVRGQVLCAVNFDNVAQQYTLGAPLNRTIDLDDFGGGVAFTANPDGGADVFTPAIQFTPRGMSNCIVTNQIYVTNQDNTIFRIQTSPTGAISIDRYNPGSNSWS